MRLPCCPRRRSTRHEQTVEIADRPRPRGGWRLWRRLGVGLAPRRPAGIDRLRIRALLGSRLGSRLLGSAVLPVLPRALLPPRRIRTSRADAVCRAQRPADAIGLLVLLRDFARLLPLRQGMSGRLESRAAGARACTMKLIFIPAATVALLAGCATPPPSGPSVMVLPGSTKSFDQFRFDDNECRQFASQSIGGTTVADAQNSSAVKSAAVGTAIGAAAGGLLGGRSGAGVGAGVGLAGGALAGTGESQASGYTLQQRYDHAYQQCMYAKGHQIPMAARYAPYRAQARQPIAPPPPPPGNPPPPPGNPPAPPAS